MHCQINWVQALDLNVARNFYPLSQNIQIIKEGHYFLHMEWLPPLNNSIGQKFFISINGTVVKNVTVFTSELKNQTE